MFDNANMTEAENRYVKKCVRTKKLPVKYRRELEALGVVFHGESCDQEKCLPVTLPSGFGLHRWENKLTLTDQDGHHVLEIYLVKRNDEKHWYRPM